MNNNSDIPYNTGNQQYSGGAGDNQILGDQQGINNSQIPQSTESGYGANYGQPATGNQNQIPQSQVPQNEQYSTQNNAQDQQEHGQETLADKVEHLLEKLADKITGHGKGSGGSTGNNSM
jgi:hypothetical protein